MNSDEKLVVRTKKNDTLGNFIQECRQRYGWTQEELGWRTGITREHVGRIERGRCIPSVQTLYDLERALNLPECSLVKRVNGQAEVDISQGAEERAGGTCMSKVGTRLDCESDQIESAEGKRCYQYHCQNAE